MPDEPDASDDDFLDWSWRALTGGIREELTDDQAMGVALFAGVPEDQIDQHKRDLEALGAPTD